MAKLDDDLLSYLLNDFDLRVLRARRLRQLRQRVADYLHAPNCEDRTAATTLIDRIDQLLAAKRLDRRPAMEWTATNLLKPLAYAAVAAAAAAMPSC